MRAARAMVKLMKPDDPSHLPASELSEAHLAAIVASSTDAIISKDRDGIVMSWNAAATRIFGWSAADMVGQSIRLIVPADRSAEEDSILSRIRAGEIVPNFETWRRHKDGHLLPVSVTVSPIRDRTGAIVGASKIAHDITERLSVRERLARSEAQFRALADNIPQLAWMAEPDGGLFWYNRRWYDYTGTEFAQMAGWGWRSVHHPDHIEGVEIRFREALAKGEPWEDTFPLRGADGAYRWFLSRARPVRSDAGEIQMWFGTNTDVTQQRENEQRIELLMGELNHRAKNMLAKVQAIVRGAARGAEPAFIAGLEQRIVALSRNQDMLLRRGLTGAMLSETVRSQTQFIDDGSSGRFVIEGEGDVLLTASAAEAIGLAIHELSTNAVKHGALANALGMVSIAWSLEPTDTGRRLALTWREIGGPPVGAKNPAGFGTILIERNPQAVMGAEVSLDFAPAGLVWTLSAPLDRITADG